jgi:LacI family transcriptional regulator
VIRGIRAFDKEKQSWSLQIFESAQSTIDEIVAWEPDGILAFCESAQHARQFLAVCRCTIAVNSLAAVAGVPAVAVDQQAVGRMAADHLIRLGLRNFACLSSPDNPFGKLRADGFSKFLLKRRRFRGPTFWHRSQDFKLSDHGDFCDWLRTTRKPVGVFAADDRLGLQICEFCRRARLRVPHDIAVVGADDDASLCQAANPPLSSVTTPMTQVGFEAAKRLDAMFNCQTFSPRTQKLDPVHIAIRESCRVSAVDDAAVAGVLKLIHSTNGRPLTVKGLLKNLSISRRTLEHRFRAAIGCSPMEEIRRVRDGRVVEMLINSDEPISKIATKCGFGSAVHLSVAFKRSRGISPRQFRQRFRIRLDAPTK